MALDSTDAVVASLAEYIAHIEIQRTHSRLADEGA